MSDASTIGSQKSDYYFSYKCANGAIGSHLIHLGSKLTPPGLSAPRCEADTKSMGSTRFFEIYNEYQNVITECVVGTDSRCAIYWSLNELDQKDVFIKNRCENLVNTLKRLPPKVYPSNVPWFDIKQGWTNVLFWFSNQEDVMVSDLGTKYPIFRQNGGAPLILAEKVGPESNHFLGPKWLQGNNLVGLWEEGLCRSAAFYQRNLREFQELEEDAEESIGASKGKNILDEVLNPGF